MIADETNYFFLPTTINDYNNKRGSYYTDDTVKIIMKDSDSQKRAIEPDYSGERKERQELEPEEIGQFLYMDVGRWGGDYDTCDAWTRRRNFGLVCGSGAILCNYKNPNTSVDHFMGTIDAEVLDYADIKKMIPLLNKLSASKILGPVTVVNALVCTDEIAEKPSSSEILVFLGDIHAPIMNICKNTYLSDPHVDELNSFSNKNNEAWSRGRIRLTDKEIGNIKLIENVVAAFLNNIETHRHKMNKGDLNKLIEDTILENKLSESLSSASSKEVMGEESNSEIFGNSFGSQQLNIQDNDKSIELSDADIIKALKIILEILLKSQKLDKWDNNETITKEEALVWFDLYHGSEKNQGVDIFQNAGEDLCRFIKLLLDYRNDSNNQELTPAKLIQLGDLFDFWLGLRRAFITIDPQKMYSNDATNKFLNFWKYETLEETLESSSINLLLNKTKDLNPEFLYGNHDSYRGTNAWPEEKKSLDHYEATGIWAEHGHQSDAFNQDSNAVIGWAASVFGFFDPDARNLEPYIRGAENWAFRTLCRRLVCIRRAACLCQQGKKRQIYVMGHTHEPILKKVLVVKEIR